MKALRHGLDCLLRATHCRCPLGSDMEEAFAASATLWRGLAELGLNVTFRFQTIEGGVNCADRYFTLNARLNLLSHRDPICAITEMQKCENYDMFEFTEIVAGGHYLYNIEEMSFRVKRMQGHSVMQRADCGDLSGARTGDSESARTWRRDLGFKLPEKNAGDAGLKIRRLASGQPEEG